MPWETKYLKYVLRSLYQSWLGWSQVLIETNLLIIHTHIGIILGHKLLFYVVTNYLFNLKCHFSNIDYLCNFIYHLFFLQVVKNTAIDINNWNRYDYLNKSTKFYSYKIILSKVISSCRIGKSIWYLIGYWKQRIFVTISIK